MLGAAFSSVVAVPAAGPARRTAGAVPDAEAARADDFTRHERRSRRSLGWRARGDSSVCRCAAAQRRRDPPHRPPRHGGSCARRPRAAHSADRREMRIAGRAGPAGGRSASWFPAFRSRRSTLSVRATPSTPAFFPPGCAAPTLETCARAGNITGALSTLRPGGTEAFRDRALREDFLRQHAFPFPL